jgi:hypothetical protein
MCASILFRVCMCVRAISYLNNKDGDFCFSAVHLPQFSMLLLLYYVIVYLHLLPVFPVACFSDPKDDSWGGGTRYARHAY